MKAQLNNIINYFGRLINTIFSLHSYSFLNSEDVEWGGYETRLKFKKLTEIPTYLIPTYPRITIFKISPSADMSNFKHSGNSDMIFDSSDFDVINYALGTMIGYQPRISEGEEINLRGSKLSVLKVEVDFLNIFDDYSMTIYGRGNNHTPVYEGRSIPYNIQINIFIK